MFTALIERIDGNAWAMGTAPSHYLRIGETETSTLRTSILLAVAMLHIYRIGWRMLSTPPTNLVRQKPKRRFLVAILRFTSASTHAESRRRTVEGAPATTGLSREPIGRLFHTLFVLTARVGHILCVGG